MKSITIKNTNKLFKASLISLSIISTSILLSSCSEISGLLKSDDAKDSLKKDTTLVIPPSLRLPNDGGTATKATTGRKSTVIKAKNEVVDSKDYYVVVGTYPNQDQALDTFVRLSSIGLPHATMESRNTKSGKKLHMVRLGPFHKQSEIDRVKDTLVNDGMSQFKVVIN